MGVLLMLDFKYTSINPSTKRLLMESECILGHRSAEHEETCSVCSIFDLSTKLVTMASSTDVRDKFTPLKEKNKNKIKIKIK